MYAQRSSSSLQLQPQASAPNSNAPLRTRLRRDCGWRWSTVLAVGTAGTARAEISEKGGSACSLFADDVDWNADTSSMRPDILEPLARTLQIFADDGPPMLTVEALWASDTPRETARVTTEQLVMLPRSSRLGTRTRYELHS
jgi:hypothetical protein